MKPLTVVRLKKNKCPNCGSEKVIKYGRNETNPDMHYFRCTVCTTAEIRPYTFVGYYE